METKVNPVSIILQRLLESFVLDDPSIVLGEPWGVSLGAIPALCHVCDYSRHQLQRRIGSEYILPARRKPAFPGMNGGGVPPSPPRIANPSV